MNSFSDMAIDSASGAPRIKAVLYCRVSSASQLKKGDGLSSQEATSREYARFRGYEVIEVFHDNVTGKVTERPAMDALLKFLRKHRGQEIVVIIDDISRFARDVRGHWDLRDLLSEAGGKLESPKMEFKDDADSVFRENLAAIQAQWTRQKNAEQTQGRMRGRLLNGYWPFHSCAGYRFGRLPNLVGKVLVRDEPLASIIQEALEGYASGRFQSQAEVARFLESQPAFPKDGKGKVRYQLANDILTRVLYAGYVERPQWEVSLRKGQHEGLIDLATFERIQKRLKAGSYAPTRPDVSADFPLRGAVSCACCGKPLTACWSKSKTGARHPYYMCFGRGCERKGKAIRRDVIEGAFAELLDGMTPKQNLFDLAHAMFKRAWSLRLDQARAMKLSCEKEMATLDKQIGVMLDRIVDASSDSVVGAYEKRIAQLERDKLTLAERREKIGGPQRSFDEMFELAFGFLANPSKLWRSGRFELQKLVLKLTFSQHLAWCPETGFQTPKTTLPFKLLGDSDMRFEKMADREGFEPPEGLHLRRFSRPEQSTTLPPTRCRPL